MTQSQMLLLAFVKRGPVWFNGAATGATMLALIGAGFVRVVRKAESAHLGAITVRGITALSEAQAG